MLRPSGLVVFAIVVLLIGVGWWLLADRLVERGVESVGASLVGARVDVASADLRLAEGTVRLTGLEVTNPDSPLRNLLVADSIAADLVLAPLLERKIVIRRLAVSGIRFNTERQTSGVLENPDPDAGLLWRRVNEWAGQIEIPSLNLDNLGGIVRVDAISADSLATVQLGRSLLGRADSLRGDWEARLRSLDPRPRIDSVSAFVGRIEAFRLTPLTALQVPGLIRDGRATLDRVTGLQGEVAALDDAVRAGVETLIVDGEDIDRLRAEDLAYARGLLNIPSFDAPTISPALFGGTALIWMKPVLYWAQTAERFLPPGLDPRNRLGPRRARAPGTTFTFPEGAEYPTFLLQEGELDLELAGPGLAAGIYRAQVRGITSSPALYGEPTEIAVVREGGAGGLGGMSLAVVLDHTGAVLRDSATLDLNGISLPGVDIGALNGRVELGEGSSLFNLSREGDEIEARLRWVSSDVSWIGGPAASAAAPTGDPLRGTAEWARALVWRTLTGVQRVELDMALAGDIRGPDLSVASNLGEAVAASLRNELGREVEAAEARLRAEVDRHIQPLVTEARSRIDTVRTEVADRVAAQRAEIDDLRARLEARLQDLVGADLGGK